MAISAAVAVGAAVGYSGYEQNKANQQQRAAQQQATLQAAKTADLADQATNAANAKTPNVAALLAGNTKGASGGTMLTGPGGVDPNTLLLGKNTLLGS